MPSSSSHSGPGQLPEHAGLEQEVGQLGLEVGQDVPREVLAGEREVRAEACEQTPPFGRRAAAARQVEQLQSCGPALGATGQHGEVARRQGLAVHVAEQLLDLPRAEPQVVGVELEQAAGDEQAGQVDVGATARGREDPHARGQMLDESLELVLGGRPEQRVQVVDAQHERLGELVERDAGIIGGPPLARRQPSEGELARCTQAREEAGGRGVGRLGGVPGARAPRIGCELGEQGRLPGARGRDDERQPVPVTRLAQRRQTPASERLRSRRACAPACWRVFLFHQKPSGESDNTCREASMEGEPFRQAV